MTTNNHAKHWEPNDEFTAADLNKLNPNGAVTEYSFSKLRFKACNWVLNNGNLVSYAGEVDFRPALNTGTHYYWVDSSGSLVESTSGFPTTTGEYFLLAQVTTTSLDIAQIINVNHKQVIS